MKTSVELRVLLLYSIVQSAISKTDKMRSGNHQVPALGRTARLGELYDAITEQFVGDTVFNSSIPAHLVTKSATPWTKSHFQVTTSLNERRNMLGLSASVTMSMLWGLVQLSLGASYMRDTLITEKAVHAHLHYETRTFKDNIDLFHSNLEPYLINLVNLGHTKATHVLTSIDYGGNVMIQFADRRPEKQTKKEVKGILKEVIEVLGDLFDEGAGSGNYDSRKDKNLVIKLFGDVTEGVNSPKTLKEVTAYIKKVPGLVRKYGGGRGKPVLYTLFPLDVLKGKMGSFRKESSRRIVHEIDPIFDEELLRVADDLTKVTQKLKNLQEEINSNSNCLHRLHDIDNLFNPIIQNYDKATSRCQSKVKQGILAVREGLLGSEGFLQQWLHECQSNPSSPSNILLRIQKPDFVRLLQKLRICQVLKSGQTQDEESFDLDNPLPSITGHYNPVEYLDTPAHLSSVLMKHMTRNVFVLFYSLEMKERDEERFTRSVAAFFRLRRSPLSQMVVVDCQNYPHQCTFNNQKLNDRVRVVQITGLKAVSMDVGAQLKLDRPKIPAFEMATLGITRKIGQLYIANARNGAEFSSRSIFRNVPSGTDDFVNFNAILEPHRYPDLHIQIFYSDRSMKIRFEALKVPQHQALPILVGETSLQSYGKYINAGPPPWSWFHPGLLSGSFVFRYTSQTISVPVDDPRFHSLINLSMIQGATHFVQEIQYGTMTIFQLRMDADKGGDAQIATNNFNSALDDLKNYVMDSFKAKGEGEEAKRSKNETTSSTNTTTKKPKFPRLPRDLKFRIYSDTLLSNPLETTNGHRVENFVEGLCNFKGVKNNGTGQPLVVVIYPVVNLQDYVGLQVLDSWLNTENNLFHSQLHLLLNILEEMEQEQRAVEDFANNFRQNIPSSICLSSRTQGRLQRFSRDFNSNVQKIKSLIKQLPDFTSWSSQKSRTSTFVNQIIQESNKLNVTAHGHVTAQLYSEFPWLRRKILLRENGMSRGILYLRGDENLNVSLWTNTGQREGMVTYILIFDEKSVEERSEWWKQNLYYMFNVLSVPIEKTKSILLDCDCQPTHSACMRRGDKPVIQEFRNGVRTVSDIVSAKRGDVLVSNPTVRHGNKADNKEVQTNEKNDLNSELMTVQLDIVSMVCGNLTNLTNWVTTQLVGCGEEYRKSKESQFCYNNDNDEHMDESRLM